MATWLGDGDVSGYSAVEGRLARGVYRMLQAQEVVDANVITRFDRHTATPVANDSWINIEATIEFSATEVAWARGLSGITKTFGLGIYLVPDNAVSYSGSTPSISALMLPEFAVQPHISNYGLVPTTNVATSVDFRVQSFGATSTEPNTKYWVVAVPGVYIQKSDGTFWGNFVPTPYDTASSSRAISMWSNRTPEPPSISSPDTGLTLEGGNTFTLSLWSNDSDALFGGTDPSYRDQAGVQVQYAPRPTAEDPNPQWRDMYFGRSSSDPNPNKSWYIIGSSLNAPQEGARTLLETGSVDIRVGGNPDVIAPNEGYLPSGSWQIRARVWDFGHPFPNEIVPFGSRTDSVMNSTASTAPAVNRSGWSEPVIVNITAQVPPPIPLYPRDNVAISIDNMPVDFRYQYRNAAETPLPQAYKSVQIRKVGESQWTDLVDHQFGTYYPVPDTAVEAAANEFMYSAGGHLLVSNEPAPVTELIEDPDFELGTTGPWKSEGTKLSGGDAREPLTVQNFTGVPPEVLSGSHALRSIEIGTNEYFSFASAAIYAGTDLLGDQPSYPPNGDVSLPDDAKYYSLSVQFYNDGSIQQVNGGLAAPLLIRNVVGGVIVDEYWFLYPLDVGGWNSVTDPATGWVELSYTGVLPDMTMSGVIDSFDDTVVELVEVSNDIMVSLTFDYLDGQAPTGGVQRVDDMYISTTPHIHYPFEESTEYEWRMKVWDISGVESDWSQIARFWVVPAPQSGVVKPVPSETIAGATLGCGTHRVEVYRRGGTERVGVLDNLSSVDWSRVRDDISTARIVVSDWGVDCGALLARLQTWAYEIVIFRDNGYSVDRVWEGPITLLTYENNRVVIQAKDIMGYAYRRILKQEMSDTRNGSKITTRAKQILQNVFAPDDPNVLSHLAVVSRNDDPMQYRHTPAYSRTAFEEVDDMAANAGLDYTVVGRSIVLWGTRNRIGLLPEFRDQDLGNSPIVSEYGMSMANFYAVSNGNGVYGSASRLNEDGEDPVYGLVEMLSSSWAADTADETGTFTQEALNKLVQSFEGFSERSIESRYPPPVVVRIPENTTLHPDVPITIQHLVPGVAIPLRSVNTLRSVKATQKLDSVRVVEDSSGETISITVSPFTRDDAEMIEEGGDL